MPSFDVVSSADLQEIDNAVENTKRQVTQRYDLKDIKSEITRKDELITIMVDNDMSLKAIVVLLKEHLAKRKISLKLLDIKKPEKAGGDMLKQEIIVKQGLSTEELKTLNKLIKAKKLKVTAQIQGDQLRVTGKKRDLLQEVIQILKEEASDLHLEFENFRD
jgi:hypothetical protein